MRYRVQSSASAGFTLIEVLIALTLLAVMLVLLFTGLRLGARSWDTGEERAGTASQVRLIQAFLRTQLSQAVPVYEKENGESRLAFKGTDDELSFIAPLPARRGLGGLYRYLLRIEESDQGKRLTLTYRPFVVDVEKDAEQEDTETMLLLDGLEKADFSFFGMQEGETEPKWRDDWDNAPDLPDLVKLEAESQPDVHLAWPSLVVALRLDATGPGGLGAVGAANAVDFGPLPGQDFNVAPRRGQ